MKIAKHLIPVFVIAAITVSVGTSALAGECMITDNCTAAKQKCCEKVGFSCKRPKLVEKDVVAEKTYSRKGCNAFGKVRYYNWVVTTYKGRFSDGSCRFFSETRKEKI